MSEIAVTLSGHVASEVVMSVVRGDVAMTKFRMAAGERRYDRDTGQWREVATSFFSVTCWRSLAENAALSLRKGQPVVLHGRLRVNEWSTDTKSGRDVEVEATHLGHDLNRGTTLFARVVRERPGQEQRVPALNEPGMQDSGVDEPEAADLEPDGLEGLPVGAEEEPVDAYGLVVAAGPGR